ncbi:hypothetical protein TNCV_5085701 [Trichonephila clavipes]|uniref:Uncharacterized protein n=1 Tax=Trichonephila clavipes TaxID=2585209 RepID=A0A8X6VIM4_TRICX|nr:hypothetical protein TNCV_5085701 [Trichonephila clavipes]
MGCHCLRYTVSPNIDTWQYDSPVIRPWHPSATCVATHGRAPRSHFSTRQCSSTHIKDCPHHIATLPLPARSPDLSPIKHIWGNLRQQVEQP